MTSLRKKFLVKKAPNVSSLPENFLHKCVFDCSFCKEQALLLLSSALAPPVLLWRLRFGAPGSLGQRRRLSPAQGFADFSQKQWGELGRSLRPVLA